jgi:hypothetical protein
MAFLSLGELCAIVSKVLVHSGAPRGQLQLADLSTLHLPHLTVSKDVNCCPKLMAMPLGGFNSAGLGKAQRGWGV